MKWLSRELRETRAKLQPNWVSLQIWLAEKIAPLHSKDAWPNCPDPYFDGAASWQDTVDCENGGSWFDSPGKYRCGLQFDPGWEIRYHVRVCP